MIRPCLMLCAALLASWTAPAAADAAADALLAAHVAASGGRDAIARIQNRVTVSKMSMGLLSAKATSRLARPDHFEDSASVLGMSSGSGYDGKVGWTSKGSKVEVVTGAELVRLQRGHRLDLVGHIDTWYPARVRLPDDTVEGAKVHAVEMTTSTGEKEIWRFDAATGLLKQLEGFAFEKGKEPAKVVSTITEYRTVDGVKLPWRIVARDAKREITITVESLVQNTALPPIVAPAGAKSP